MCTATCAAFCIIFFKGLSKDSFFKTWYRIQINNRSYTLVNFLKPYHTISRIFCLFTSNYLLGCWKNLLIKPLNLAWNSVNYPERLCVRLWACVSSAVSFHYWSFFKNNDSKGPLLICQNGISNILEEFHLQAFNFTSVTANISSSRRRRTCSRKAV